jgi:hypothetical protein
MNLILIISSVILAIVLLIIISIFFQYAQKPLEPFICSSLDNNNNSTNGSKYLINLSSGDREIYERKSTISFEYPQNVKRELVGWGDKLIPIYGNIIGLGPSVSLSNKLVVIEANLTNGDPIYLTVVKTDNCGHFTTSFFSPVSERILVSAKLLDNELDISTAISVVVTESWMPAILIMISITISIAIIVMLWNRDWLRYIESKSRWLSNKNLNYESAKRGGLIPLMIMTIFSYIILYKYAPFGNVENAAIAAVLVAPIAAYIFKILDK